MRRPRTSSWPSGWRLLVALCLGALPGCRCSGDPTPAVSEGLAACRAACASYVSARCPGRGEAAREQAECVSACTTASDLGKRADCAGLRAAYLDCVGRSSIECSGFVSTPSVALEHAEGATSCGAAFAKLEACTAPCRNEGSVHLGDREVRGRKVQGELTRDGCVDCKTKTRGGAPPGSPCQAARVCAEQCCNCGQTAPAHYRARACIDGTCADQASACEFVPAAVDHDACARN